MKLLKNITLILITLVLAQMVALANPNDESALIKNIETAYQKNNAELLVSLTLWEGVSVEEKQTAIKKYEREVALNMTRIEFKDAEPKYWKNWKKGDVEFTYNLPVTKEIVVHLEEGSKIKLSFGVVPVKDIKIPVGKKAGKWYLLKSVEVKNKEQP